MRGLTQALRDMYLTAHDFVIPPEPEPAPTPRAAVEVAAPEPESHRAVVHPRVDDPTEDTVQAWLDAAVAPVPVDGCFHCDRAPEEHGLRYAALVGPHHYAEPTVFQVNQRKRAHNRAQQEDAC